MSFAMGDLLSQSGLNRLAEARRAAKAEAGRKGGTGSMKPIFMPISKVDEEKRMVWGYASTETLDSQGEVVKRKAVEDALDDYMKWANIREMHGHSAVGVAKEANLDGNGLYIGAKVVDDQAWNKVKEGVYKGFSIGGKAISKVSGVIHKMRMTEISLVDRPANPDCKFDVWKADGLPLNHSAKGGDKGMNVRKYQDGNYLDIRKKEFSEDKRQELADKGHALPDGSFPIENTSDLKNAIQSYGRAKDKAKAKAHIIARAKALGATNLLPEDWEGSSKDKESKKVLIVGDIRKYAGEEIWDVKVAIEALDSIYGLLLKEMSENEPEDGQVEALEVVVERLKEFIVSELGEDSLDDMKSQLVAMAAQIDDLKKESGDTHGKGTAFERVKAHAQTIHDHALSMGAKCEGCDEEKMAKATDGRSKEDMEKLQEIHDHSHHLGADCNSEKAAAAGTIKKLEGTDDKNLTKGGGQSMNDKELQQMIVDKTQAAVEAATKPLRKQNEELVEKLQMATVEDAIQKAVTAATQPLIEQNAQLQAKITKIESAPAYTKAFMAGAGARTIEKIDDGKAATITKGDDVIAGIKDPENISKVDRPEEATAMIKNIIGGRRHARSAAELGQLGISVRG